MKKILLASVITLFFGFNAQAMEVKPYISGKVNINFIDVKFDRILISNEIPNFNDSILGGSIAVGFSNINNSPLRTEIEFNFSSKIKQIGDYFEYKANYNSCFLNFYYDFYNKTNFIPYITGGLGFIKINVDIGREKPEATNFSWQAGAGLYYKLNNYLFFDLGVKYNRSSIDYSGYNIFDLNTIISSIGLRYNF